MEQIIGEIRFFCGNFAPQGWAFCDGQILSISQYTPLFSLIGNAYGGDGRTTFALPDLRERLPVGTSNPTQRGQKGGAVSAVLQAGNLPAHTHSFEVLVNVSDVAGSQKSPVNNYPAKTGNFDKEYNVAADSTMAKDAVEITVQSTGAAAPFSLMQPSQTVNFIIALTGDYPPRWD